MSIKYLGQTFDIHGGGLDLQFPHHENELAQSESYSDATFAKYWMHNGLLKMGQSKMAGSVGNVVNVVDLLAKHQAETVRFLLLRTHYRSPIEYSEASLQEAGKAIETFYRFFERYQRITGQSFYALAAPTKRSDFDPGQDELLHTVAGLRKSFLEAMEDDFNTGGAMGVLYELLSALNRFADATRLEGGKADAHLIESFQRGTLQLRELSQILGLFWAAPQKATSADDELLGQLMTLLIDLRAQARKDKNFAMADQIRKRLTEIGVTLEDRPGGTDWRKG